MARGVDDTASYLTPGDGDAWGRAVRATGARGTQKLRAAARVTPPDWVAKALSPPPPPTDVAAMAEIATADKEAEPAAPPGLVIARRRTMYLDDEPVELTDSYYPLEVAAGTALERPGRIPGGAVTLLAELGYRAHHADEAVDLDSQPTVAEADLLGVEPTARVVRIRRVVRTAAGAPFETMEIVMLPAGRTLRHRVVIEP